MDSTAVPQTSLNLRLVIDEAIRRSLEEAESLEKQITAALEAFDPLLPQVGASGDSLESVQALRAALQNARLAAEDLFQRQRAVLGTVNVALFGRTGAGKSSLIEALSCGSGTTISTGETDFTTEVKPTRWHGIQFLDTPGINGWGRTMKRDDLESRARKAVEIADIVVLCFDSINQQASEFEKVALWVKEFGKPVVTMLNIKDSHWRWQEKVPLGSGRRRSAQKVREHASNISAGLADIGIHSAPVIAIAAQRAVYARTSDAFEGPIPEQCSKMREILGRERLLRQSNLQVFEQIIIEALSRYAVEIRLDMLHAQLRSLVGRLLSEVQEAGAAAQAAAGALDSVIKSILEVVGYPPEGSARRAALIFADLDLDLLTLAEQARGDAYSMSAEGRAARYARQRCGSEVGKLREDSLRTANALVSDCFDRGTQIGAEEFNRRIFLNPLIEETVKKVLTESAQYLERELALSLADAKLDMEFAARQGAQIFGNAGKALRYGGLAARVAAMLAGAATMLAFTPEPVISKVTSVVLGIAAGLVGWLGEWLTGKAKAQRESSRAQACADITRSVNETYDRIAEQVNSSMDTLLQIAGKQALTPPLCNAIALWTFAAKIAETTKRLVDALAALPASGDAQALLSETAVHVAKLSGGKSVNVESVLLGEDWVSDVTGLVAETGSSIPLRSRVNDAGIFERLFTGLQRFGFQFAAKVKKGAGAEWLVQTEAVLADDEMTAPALCELRAILATGKPRYYLLGDYNTGKTSFIKRLLLDSGLPLPATLEVRADPATDTTHCYEWEGAILVDTPGLQSSKQAHAEAAIQAVADASLLICLFQPNLLVGNTSALENMLIGDPAMGAAAKLNRTIFVIHRADELGPDPDLVPDHYINLCERKRLELQQALGSKGIGVELERIVCMAADPHGTVGNRSDVNSKEYDPFRQWDGFKKFHATMRTIHAKHGAIGLDYSLLEGGLARFGRINARLRESVETMEILLSAFSRQQRIFSEITENAEHLEGDLTDQARRLIQDYAQSLRAREALTKEDLKIKVNALAKWWEQPDFIAKAEHWQKSTQQQIEAWWKESSERLSRTLKSPRFAAAIACADAVLDESKYDTNKGYHLKRVIETLARPLKGTSRDVAYAVGKLLGGNFKPWGAVKLAKGLRGVGIVLGALMTAWDAVSLWIFFKDEKRSRQREQELDEFINQTTKEVFRSITQSGDESIGPVEALRGLRQELVGVGQELAAEGDKIRESKRKLDEQRYRIQLCMNNAWDALRLPHPTYE